MEGVLNVPNRTLYHGDNLDFMRALDSNSVHLIATDPPFNKGRDFHATPDSLAAGAICIAIPSSLNCGTSVNTMSVVAKGEKSKGATGSVSQTESISSLRARAASLCGGTSNCFAVIATARSTTSRMRI